MTINDSNNADLKLVCLVGSFPPPVTGMTSVNAAIKQYLDDSSKIKLTTIDLSPQVLNRTSGVRLLRLVKIVKGLKLYLQFLSSSGKKTTLYLCISGGFGQIYELLFISLSRLFRRKIILHHHCSSYLIKPNLITKLLTIIAGIKSVHIVLCSSMGSRLKENYSLANNILVLSNATLIEKFSIAPIPRGYKLKLETIGFIGNITRDKGIFEVIEVAKRLQEEGLALKVVVAGPFSDANLKSWFFKELTVLNTIDYVGPKYDEEKLSFYKSIDVLLFPTKYVNEAEPLTIYEAMAHGVPVIAWGRGCIPYMIPENTGSVVNINENFVEIAIKQIKVWKSDEIIFRNLSDRAINQFVQTKKQYAPNLDKLLNFL